MLLVCAGSDPGRVPFVFASRDAGAGATVKGSEVCFSYAISSKTTWHFTLITASGDLAQDLARKLARREIYSLHPDDQILAIVFRRDDFELEPLWIGGDLSQIAVDPTA